MIWRSLAPCVVIGRHQCVWQETNPQELAHRGWSLARRASGGGAVFHDAGNINVTFMEARRSLDRTACNRFLADLLTSRWPYLDVRVGSRYDMWLARSKESDHSDVN
ncbi:unnamed protein product [Protopolystoma xenopodis]|uniref:BPL/LPL catalytic domain-containing protein n=1 Tax=Protopolystoma xenopodis TaxID=117903 RepID=A0A448XF28_9PLAT|nr:unnamed protein product [Protopolystoma xenopodis]